MAEVASNCYLILKECAMAHHGVVNCRWFLFLIGIKCEIRTANVSKENRAIFSLYVLFVVGLSNMRFHRVFLTDN